LYNVTNIIFWTIFAQKHHNNIFNNLAKDDFYAKTRAYMTSIIQNKHKNAIEYSSQKYIKTKPLILHINSQTCSPNPIMGYWKPALFHLKSLSGNIIPLKVPTNDVNKKTILNNIMN
jgi:hypothetical protein